MVRLDRWDWKNWDWRPLARLIVWAIIAVAAGRRAHLKPPSLAAVCRELFLGYMLTFGILTWIQIRLLLCAVHLFFFLDDSTYWMAKLLTSWLPGNRWSLFRFVAALAVQVGLVGTGIALLRTYF